MQTAAARSKKWILFVNFTREPIIETIITPKEGYKLVVRSSKNGGREEYVVDAIEVVSFGHSFFFRSMERPKSFLVPVSDFEVIETKETRVVLKSAHIEHSIKIGGGKVQKEKVPQVEAEQQPAAVEQRLEKKRERKRHRRRRGAGSEEIAETVEQPKAEKEAIEGGVSEDEIKKVSSSTVSRLIPPPAHLISYTLGKEKPPVTEATEGNVLPSVEEERPKKRRKKSISSEEDVSSEEEESDPPQEEGEGDGVHRMAQEPTEVITSTSFSTLERQDTFFGKIW